MKKTTLPTDRTAGPAGAAGTTGVAGTTGAAPLTYRGLVRFFLPLSLSDMIMVLSGPLISAFLGRLPDAKVQIAAFGVAQTVAILLESPIIMILQAATASAGNPAAYRTLGKLMWLWNGTLTLLYALVAFTPAYDWVANVALGLPPEVAAAARPALGVMLLWPAAIGYRRYMQGQLIYHRRSQAILYSGLFRLFSLSATLVAAAPSVLFPGLPVLLPGAVVAGLALQASVIGEAVAVAWFNGRLRRELQASRSEAAPREGQARVPAEFAGLFWWYLPLAGTQVLVWLARPLLTGGIARAGLAALSLAAWPAVWSTVSMVANGTRMVQQMTISLVRDPDSARRLRRFTWGVGVAFSLALALLAFTPLATLYLEDILALPADVAAVALPVLALAAIYPLQVALQNWMQGLLVQSGRTGLVNAAAFAGGSAAVLLVYTGALLWQLPGAALAAAASILGLSLELGLLWNFSRPARQRFEPARERAGTPPPR